MTGAQFASLGLCGLVLLIIIVCNVYEEYQAVRRRYWLLSKVVMMALEAGTSEWPIQCQGTATATANVRLRAYPDLAARTLDVLPSGTPVDVWARVDSWWLVQTVSGLTGWSSATYLRPIGELKA